MAHKTRAEQLALKVRKDPKKKAWQSKRHNDKTAYKRVRLHKEDIANELVN